jgi:DNA-directed RNA polymerase subunit RPC12/RpoP
MVIEIIDDTPDPKVQKEIVCYRCGVRLRYVPADVQSYENRDYTGCLDTYRYIDCPKCKERLYV